MNVPLPTSETFDRLAATTSTRRLTRFIKADIRTRLEWRKYPTRPSTAVI